MTFADEEGHDHVAGTQGRGQVGARSHMLRLVRPGPSRGVEGALDVSIGRGARFHHQRDGEPGAGFLAVGLFEVRDRRGRIVRIHRGFP